MLILVIQYTSAIDDPCTNIALPSANKEMRVENKTEIDINDFRNCMNKYDSIFIYNVTITGNLHLSVTSDLFASDISINCELLSVNITISYSYYEN